MMYLYVITILIILHGNDCQRIQRRHPLMRYREVACKFQIPNDINNCVHGFYKDRCQQPVCYKGLNESCNRQTENGSGGGLCADGLTCNGCGRCVGCLNDKECMLQLEQCNHGNSLLMAFEANSNPLTHIGRVHHSNSIQQLEDDNDNIPY